MNPFYKKAAVIVFALMIIAAIIFKFFISVERIDAGCVGIRVNLVGSDKGVDDITEVTGYTFYAPLISKIYEFPVYTQTKDYKPFKVNAKDGSEFIVDPTLTYYVDAKRVPDIFRQYRMKLTDLENGVIRTVIYDSYRITANSFSSDSLMSNRGLFESNVQNRIQTAFEKMGFIFQNLTSNLEPPQSLKDAVDAKNEAVQEALLAENKIREAEADAKARKIKADIERYENEQKNAALNSLIIQQKMIEKWDGKLPVYGEVPQLFQNITTGYYSSSGKKTPLPVKEKRSKK